MCDFCKVEDALKEGNVTAFPYSQLAKLQANYDQVWEQRIVEWGEQTQQGRLTLLHLPPVPLDSFRTAPAHILQNLRSAATLALAEVHLRWLHRLRHQFEEAGGTAALEEPTITATNSKSEPPTADSAALSDAILRRVFVHYEHITLSNETRRQIFENFCSFYRLNKEQAQYLETVLGIAPQTEGDRTP